MQALVEIHQLCSSRVADHRQHPLYSDQDAPASSTRSSQMESLWSVGRACTHQLQSYNVRCRFCERATRLMAWLKRSLAANTNLKSAMPYTQKIEGLEQRKSYFEAWQNEVADRLPGKKTASMGKFDTPATKTMENTRFSLEGKRAIEILKAAL